MATRTLTVEREAPRAAAREYPTASTAFTWLAVVLGAWVVTGLYVDGWAHNHRQLDIILLGPSSFSQTYAAPGLPSTLASWHVVYYTGLTATGLLLVFALLHHRGQGYPWMRALPAGYGAALLGVLLVAAGGVGELLWPASFIGYPPDILGSAALTVVLSPPRLLEAVGLALAVSGPLLACGMRPGAERDQRWRGHLPLVLSLTFLLSVLTFVTQFAHPLVDPWAALSYLRRSLQSYRYGQFIFGESLGVLSILLQSALAMGLILPALRRWPLRPGSLTLVFTVNALLMSFLQGYYAFVAAAAAAGGVADVLLKRMRWPAVRPLEFRLFAFAVPAVYYLFYFLVLTQMAGIAPSWGTEIRILVPQPIEGIGWNVQLWTGTVLGAGLVGWLVSLLVLPPAGPSLPVMRSE